MQKTLHSDEWNGDEKPHEGAFDEATCDVSNESADDSGYFYSEMIEIIRPDSNKNRIDEDGGNIKVAEAGYKFYTERADDDRFDCPNNNRSDT